MLELKYVYVVDKTGKVKARTIKTGAELPHLYEVKSGLNEKDLILLEGLRKVRDGDKIHYQFVAPETVLKKFNQLYAE